MAAIHYEMIIRGNQELLCAYLQGFLNGRRIKRGVIFSNQCPLQIHHIRELIQFHGSVIHLVCRSSLQPLIVAAIKSAPPDYSFEIKRARKISKASFGFEFETFSTKVAGAIKRTLSRIPSELKLIGYKPREEIDPEAVGVEGYAPMHDYRFHGAGKVSGDIEKLLEFHKRLSRNEFMELGEISIYY